MTTDNKETSVLKRLLYIFFIGIIIYYGGRGWACLFTSDREERNKVGMLSLLVATGELALILLTFFVNGFSDTPVFDEEFYMFMIRIMFWHAVVSVIGCFIAGIAALSGKD